MTPLRISATALLPASPREIAQGLLDLPAWSTFQGAWPLPGITRAEFEHRTPEVVGSRIRVHNTDGSRHVEVVVEWDPERAVAMRFEAFQRPLSAWADHFLERWTFAPVPGGTRVSREMDLVPRSWLGALALRPIAWLMRRALERQLEDLSRRPGSNPGP